MNIILLLLGAAGLAGADGLETGSSKRGGGLEGIVKSIAGAEGAAGA